MEYKNSNKKVAFCSLGCKVNQYETNAMAQKFVANGYEIVEFDEYADVYIVNTCTVTNIADRKSRQMLRRAKEINKDATLVACGCYAQVAKEELKKIPEIDLIIGNNEKNDIISIIENHIAQKGTEDIVSDVMYKLDYVELGTTTYTEKTRAVIKIQDGCDRFCSYCLIPYARGHIRSRKIENVIEEIKKVVEEGINEVVITGIHIASYGRDFKGENISLSDAVEICLANENLKRLRLGSLESIEISPRLLELVKTHKRFTKHLHLPLQAGSDEILKAMNRHYTTEEFARLIENIRREVPDIAISTDIIVGFPGETDELFQKSLEFAKSMGFMKMHVFPYSKRAGTPAAKMTNQIDEAVKKQRVHLMQKMAEQSAVEFYQRFLGRELEVLFEQEQDGYMEGLTSNYIRVYIKNDGEITSGDIRLVKLVKLFKDGILGELI